MDRWERPQRPDELYHWVTPKTHRYIAKIGEGKDARYFYSQEELQAFKSGASNAASKAGQVAQRAVSTAHQRAANAMNTAGQLVQRTARKVGDKAQDMVWDAEEKVANAKKKVDKAIDEHITGESRKDKMRTLDAKRRVRKDLLAVSKRDEKYPGAERDYQNRLEDDYNKATNEKARVRRDYEANTLAGRAEKAGRQINRKLDNAERSVKKAAKEAGDTASWVKKRVGEEAREAADSVSKTAKSAGNTVRDKAKEAYDYHVTGEGYKRDAKAQKKASKQFEKDSKYPSAMDRGQASKMAREYKEAANKSEQNYKTKSVKGNAERASDFIAKHLKKKRKK